MEDMPWKTATTVSTYRTACTGIAAAAGAGATNANGPRKTPRTATNGTVSANGATETTDVE